MERRKVIFKKKFLINFLLFGGVGVFFSPPSVPYVVQDMKGMVELFLSLRCIVLVVSYVVSFIQFFGRYVCASPIGNTSLYSVSALLIFVLHFLVYLHLKKIMNI